ncbi:ST3 beta-galactoside alpha-2,3-sialyltransferase 8 [Gouania willdenowi]|uniref:CMP-N-acetylneuraminate-beta-galactosamide-alpha-2,3-sialyltransferase 2 n=1 Tax=Gouania willdenowi TaxID=441366 RepID=A0A8C5DZ58_GOUWI|nr:CMP-N-acetylneuraminate-beta-galactosamide-alpha-2,3-sialyltransferase 2-like [Gouania willdenowi]
MHSAMFLRKKLCVAAVIATILFLMLASQSIQKRNFLLPLAQPDSSDKPNSRETGIGLSQKHLSHEPSLPPRKELSDTKDPEKEDEEEEGEEESLKESQDDQRLCGCSESCVSDLDGSKWFSQRYDPKQQPILQDTDKFDAGAVSWWLSLQRSSKDQTLEGVMSELFKVIASPTLDFKPLPSQCRSCAVVGNSGNLRNSGHGNLINSHGIIIRMNKAVTRGFEKDVGNRTTHHLLYPESAVDIEHGVRLILLPFKLKDLEWLTSALSTGHIKMTYMKVKERINADKDKVLVVNPVFFQYVHDHWTEHHGRYPSTGMMALIFSLHICDQVSVFGYGADKQGNWDHYWENNPHAGAFRKTGVHSADFEHEVIHQLAKEGKINLHK